MRVLAGDIGGTKALVGLIDVDEGRATIVAQERYASAEHAGVEEIVERFVRAHGGLGLHACFGVAGPVVDDACQVTNLPWAVDARSLERVFGGAARLLNDFAAAAYGIEVVAPDRVSVLHEGAEVARAPRAVLGAGTGLGEALLYWANGHYEVLPTEGGHADLAPRDDDEIALLRWLLARHGRASYERVVSGPGLRAVYEHLREAGFAPESGAVRADMAGGDPSAAISKHADDDALCGRAFAMFAGLYGAEAGNLALKSLARGGVYLAGGIAAKELARLARGPFLASMHAKGRMSDLVRAMPVRVVTEQRLGLLGAAAFASRMT